MKQMPVLCNYEFGERPTCFADDCYAVLFVHQGSFGNKLVSVEYGTIPEAAICKIFVEEIQEKYYIRVDAVQGNGETASLYLAQVNREHLETAKEWTDEAYRVLTYGEPNARRIEQE